MIMVLFLAKNSRISTHNELISYHGAKSTIGFSKILCVSDELLQAHNFGVVSLIDRTTLLQEFMMHHAIAIEENGDQISTFDRT